jgi:hypothetical protein
MTGRASASENETNQTGQRREQVRGLPGYRFCDGQTACATWPPDLSAAMCEVPRLGPDQEDRRLNARGVLVDHAVVAELFKRCAVRTRY